ncbi:MAG: preprotein translocase subunit YajC [Parvibaculales bacterium]
MLITPAYAQSVSGGGAILEMLFPLILVFAIVYFMILRPQQKRQRAHRAMLEDIRRNDVVVTQGGLVGKVAKVGDEELEVTIAENTRVSVIKSMIVSVRAKNDSAKAE